jgi:hypothetical protein
MSKDTTQPLQTRQVHRLSQEALMELRKKLPLPDVSSTTTDLEAGYKLGIQKVLDLLREGFVIGG